MITSCLSGLIWNRSSSQVSLALCLVLFLSNLIQQSERRSNVSIQHCRVRESKVIKLVWHLVRLRDSKALSSSFIVAQSLSHVWLFETSWTAAHQASLSFTISQSLPKLMSIESVMPSNHLILCHPLLFLPSIFPSIRVFSSESALHIRWSKYWGFCFSISPSNKYSGLISFRIDWFDLLAVQGLSRFFSSTTVWKHQLV